MSAETYPTVVCSQCGTQLGDSSMVVRPVGSTASVVRQQRLALRHLARPAGSTCDGMRSRWPTAWRWPGRW
jgi:hypothetical protein